MTLAAARRQGCGKAWARQGMGTARHGHGTARGRVATLHAVMWLLYVLTGPPGPHIAKGWWLMGRQIAILRRAAWRVFDDGGVSMAGAVAFSFLLSLFPFCIFLGALAGTLGGRELAAAAIAQLFQAVPETVAKALAPEVEKVMGQSQYGLVTIGAAISLFFATSAIESLRAALNSAYGVREGR